MQPGAPRERPLQRQVFSDFTRPAQRDPSMRPMARPAHQQVQPTPVQPVASAHPHHVKPAHPASVQAAPAPQQPMPPTAPTLTAPAHIPAHTPAAAPASALRPPTAFSDFAAPAMSPVAPAASTPAPSQLNEPESTSQATEPALQPPRAHDHHEAKHHKAKEPGPKNTTGHSGAVGFVSFIVLCALFFLPLLPGKVLDNFPGSSASFSTGDQALSCIDALGPVHSTVKYDTKMGFPITYNYSTTTTQTATCKGVTQSATGGHTSQFNPLGGLINATTAFVLAFGIAKLWRYFAGSKS